MGWRAGNVHVHTGGRAAPEVFEQVVAAVRNWILNSPGEYEEITADTNDTSEQRADRSVIIGPLPTPGQKWIGVYDEFTDSQDIDLVNESAQLISEATRNYTLGLVGGSNLYLSLYRDGNLVDKWSDEYDHYEEEDIADMDEEETAEMQEYKAAHIGHPERWQELLKPGATIAELETLWREWNYGQDKAEDIAELIELTHTSCLEGYYHFYEPEGEDAPKFINLAFRSKAAPAFFAKAEGLPQLQMSSWTSSVDLLAGQTWEHCSFGIGNAGGGGKGVQVLVWGSAIEQQLLEPSRLRLIPPMILSAMPSYSAPPQDYDFGTYQTPDGKTVWYVNAPDFDIPAGSQSSLGEAYQSGVAVGRALAANFLGQFSVVLSGKSRQPGEGELYLGVAPLENYEQGRISHAIPVRVQGSKVQGWLPLPFAKLPEIFRTQAAMPHFVKMLEPTAPQCWALVTLPAERSGYQKLFVEVIEDWHNFLAEKADGKNYAVTTMGSNPFDSKMVKLPFQEIPDGAKWQNFRETIINASRFMAMSDGKKTSPDRYSPPHISSSGFAFSIPMGAMVQNTAMTDVSGFLALWVDTLGWESSDVAAAETRLVELVHRLMSEADGYQAFVTQQGGYPHNPDQPTPYEYLASVSTDRLENPAWCKNFVRGISENMWLGRHMLSRLRAVDSEAEQKLARIAELQPSGDGLFIRLRDISQLAELEKILVPLTPVMENVGEFMAKLR